MAFRVFSFHFDPAYDATGFVKRVAIALELDQYNVLQNNGPRAGQTVYHAHVHLVPTPTGATGLMVQPGLAAVDQTGLAERIRSRLAAPRS